MDKTMKILQVNKYYSPKIGGIEHVIQQIAEGLNDRTDMTVLVCQDRKAPRTEETVNGVKVIRSRTLGVVSSMPVSLGFFSDFRTLARQADIVLVHMPFPLADLACLLSGYKGKVIVWWHVDVVRQKKLMFFYRPIMKRFLGRADRIIVATEGHITGSAYLGPYASKCEVIPFGVEDSLLEDGKKHLEPHTGRPDVHFLFIGRLVYYKGCDCLLRAFARMTNKDTRLTLVGDGPLRQELENSAQELKVADRVVFTGPVDDERLREEIADCDVFVLPSSARTEAFGIVQIEAMAYGRPVINTNLPTGVPYVSLHGETGLTVEPGDDIALAHAMDELAGDEERRVRYGRNARLRVENNFRLSAMVDKVLVLCGRELDEEE